MKESDFCTIIGKSLDYVFKIPDSCNLGSFRQQLPFDGIAVHCGKSMYWEAKFLPKPMSFNLHRIEDHQLKNLSIIKQLNPDSICVILLGVDYGRGDKRVYAFTDLDELDRRRKAKQNILKKELVAMPYYKISKGVIQPTLITP